MIALLIALQAASPAPEKPLPPEFQCAMNGARSAVGYRENDHLTSREMAGAIAKLCSKDIPIQCEILPPAMQPGCDADRDRLIGFLADAAYTVIAKARGER